jgi:hypothetical protein
MDSAIAGLIGAGIGAAAAFFGQVLSHRHQHRLAEEDWKRRYREKQLSELYSPLAAYQQRILAKLQLQKKISKAANASWQEICKGYADAKQIFEDHEEKYKPFKRIIEYNNRQFEQELFPLYRKMLDLFTEKYWLAAPDTRSHYRGFLEYVEIWERWLAESLPGEVAERLEHEGSAIEPFHRHVEDKLNDLQGTVNGKSGGKQTVTAQRATKAEQ